MERQDTLPTQFLSFSDSEQANASQNRLMSQETLDHLFNTVGSTWLQAVMKENDPLLSVSNVDILSAPDQFTAVISKGTDPHLPPHDLDIRTETFTFTPLNDGFVLPQRMPSTGSFSFSQLLGSNSFLNSLSQPTATDTSDNLTANATADAFGFGQLAVSSADTGEPSSSTTISSTPQIFTTELPQQNVDHLKFQVPYPMKCVQNCYNSIPQGPVVPNSSGLNQQYHNILDWGGAGGMSAKQKNELGRPIDSVSPQGGLAPPAVSPVTPTGAVNDIPSNVPYPGQFAFEVFFTKAKEVASKKTISYTFSLKCNKLYVKQAAVCPIHFKVAKKPPSSSYIRAMVVYSRPQDIGDVVKRCMNHTMEDNHMAASHLVRMNHNHALYFEDPLTTRHSVTIPWEEPPAGSDYITGMYQFMCFSSCTGTINRRPTQIIFSLENEGKVIGRQVVELRICACPGRDLQNDEELLNPSKKRGQRVEKTSTITSLEPLSKRPKPNDDDVYTVEVRGRELYKLVTTIVQNYQLAQHYTDLVATAQSMTKLQEPLVKVSQEVPIGATDVGEWLKTIEMGHFARKFYDNRYKTMSQLDNITMDNLEKIGIPSDDRDRLFASLLHWKAAKSLSQMSSLPTPPNASGGFKICRTTINHRYKIKKSPVAGQIERESDD